MGFRTMLVAAHLTGRNVLVMTSHDVNCYGKVVAMTENLVQLRSQLDHTVIRLGDIEGVKLFLGAS